MEFPHGHSCLRNNFLSYSLSRRHFLARSPAPYCSAMKSRCASRGRLELGHQLEPTSLRTTEFAAAISPSEPTATCPASSVPSCGYGPPTTATSWKAGRFTGADFPLQPDGTLRCPAGQVLTAHEQRARRSMAVCVWCMGPASVVVVPVPYGSSVNGREVPPRSRARSVCFCIPLRLVRLLCSGEIGVADFIDVRACTRLAFPARRGTGRIREFCLPTSLAGVPLPSRASTFPSQLARTLRSQCAPSNGEPGNHPPVRRPERLCGLARFGDNVTFVSRGLDSDLLERIECGERYLTKGAER